MEHAHVQHLVSQCARFSGPQRWQPAHSPPREREMHQSNAQDFQRLRVESQSNYASSAWVFMNPAPECDFPSQKCQNRVAECLTIPSTFINLVYFICKSANGFLFVSRCVEQPTQTHAMAINYSSHTRARTHNRVCTSGTRQSVGATVSPLPPPPNL